MAEARTSHARPSTTHAALGGRTILEPADDRGGHRYLMGGSVTCNLGKLVNLSERGALIVSRTPLATTVPFCVTDGACRVVCDAKVMRTRRLSEHRHSCALQFGELRPECSAALQHIIARHHIPCDALRREAA